MYETGIRLKNGQTLKSLQVLEDPMRVLVMKSIAQDTQRHHSLNDLTAELETTVDEIIESIAHLEEAGLVEATQGLDPEGRPNGSEYSLTENGRILVIDIRAEQLWMKRLGDLLNGR